MLFEEFLALQYLIEITTLGVLKNRVYALVVIKVGEESGNVGVR